MPPKAAKRLTSTLSKTSNSSSSSSGSSKKEKSSSRKKQKTGAPSDSGKVRLDSPGCGLRADEVIQDHDALRSKYMLTEAVHGPMNLSYMTWKAGRGLEGDEKTIPILPKPNRCFAATENQPVLFSTWWPTNGIILPSSEHFPQPKASSNQQSEEETKPSCAADIGLIRPVNMKQAEALIASFEDNGGLFDPSHPVSSRFFAFVFFMVCYNYHCITRCVMCSCMCCSCMCRSGAFLSSRTTQRRLICIRTTRRCSG